LALVVGDVVLANQLPGCLNRLRATIRKERLLDPIGSEGSDPCCELDRWRMSSPPVRVAIEILEQAERLGAREVEIRRELARGMPLSDALAKYGHV
jgi:hypothetical protein